VRFYSASSFAQYLRRKIGVISSKSSEKKRVLRCKSWIEMETMNQLKILLLSALLCAFAMPVVAHAQSKKKPIDLNQQHPDVVDVKVRQARDGKLFDFDVTLSSPYDTNKRYADAFRVGNGKGLTFGERVLLHDHKDEQPFTRDLYDVDIPLGVKEVVVQGRDQKFGYGGKTLTVKLPGR
jgi:hypothetical protein